MPISTTNRRLRRCALTGKIHKHGSMTRKDSRMMMYRKTVSGRMMYRVTSTIPGTVLLDWSTRGTTRNLKTIRARVRREHKLGFVKLAYVCMYGVEWQRVAVQSIISGKRWGSVWLVFGYDIQVPSLVPCHCHCHDCIRCRFVSNSGIVDKGTQK